MKKSILATVLVSALAGATAAHAANIVPVNRDPANAGLNDPTARAPEGNNPGTSVGEQRRLVYQFAAGLWGAVLKSNVDIRVEASFQPLSCTATSGTLGSAGPNFINRDFPNAPTNGVWYHSALANSIAGENLNADGVPPDDVDIVSRFNSALGGLNPDGSECLTGSGWYYGLDGNTPVGAINFLDVVMHEIAHGLGFSGFLDKTTGELPVFDDTGVKRLDAYTYFAYDNVRKMRFGDPSMTAAMRAEAMRTPGRLAWDGGAVKVAAPLFLAPLMKLQASGTLTASYDYGTASFGAPVTAANFSGTIVSAMSAGSTPPPPAASTLPQQACEPLTPASAAAVSGNIAIVDRGSCGFAVKAKNAQNAGAIGVIVANNVAGAAPGLGGADNTVTIPTLSVSQADGMAIRAALPGVNAAIVTVPGQFFGADSSGRALLYSPTVVAGGSTFSHYDTSLTPNALQEPNISVDLDGNVDVDLNVALFSDMGWGLNTGTAKTRNGRCDTGVPVLTSPDRPGFIGGANLQAADSICRRPGTSRIGVRSCMAPFLNELRAEDAIPATAATKVAICTL